jgi:hypothetical protein
MSLITLVYVSSAAKGFAPSAITDILKASRRNNERDGITGILLYKDGNFMQVLEGGVDAVEAAHARIITDPRHSGLITLLKRPLQARVFADWKMGFKDISRLAAEDRAAHSDYLDVPLDDGSFVAHPAVAMRLLESFKKTVR